MASVVNRLRIQSLKEQIEASRLESVTLANQFEAAPTGAEKARIARQYDQSLKQTHAMQFLLGLLERKEREADGEAAES